MRKPIASLILLVFIIAWAMIAATVGSAITDWPRWTQLVFYAVAGTGWILPLRPLFRWMNSPTNGEES